MSRSDAEGAELTEVDAQRLDQGRGVVKVKTSAAPSRLRYLLTTGTAAASATASR